MFEVKKISGKVLKNWMKEVRHDLISLNEKSSNKNLRNYCIQKNFCMYEFSVLSRRILDNDFIEVIYHDGRISSMVLDENPIGFLQWYGFIYNKTILNENIVNKEDFIEELEFIENIKGKKFKINTFEQNVHLYSLSNKFETLYMDSYSIKTIKSKELKDWVKNALKDFNVFIRTFLINKNSTLLLDNQDFIWRLSLKKTDFLLKKLNTNYLRNDILVCFRNNQISSIIEVTEDDCLVSWFGFLINPEEFCLRNHLSQSEKKELEYIENHVHKPLRIRNLYADFTI